MRRLAVRLAVLAMVLGTSALANLRAPRRVDGVFSGALAGIRPDLPVRLRAETLRLVFPEVDFSRPNPGDKVRVAATYEFENASSTTVALAVRFIALDLGDISVILNSRPLSVRSVESPEDKSECLAALGKHRSAFLPSFYRDFLGRLKNAAGLGSETEDSWTAGLAGRDLSAVPFPDIFERIFEEPPKADFPAAEFELVLVPGMNILLISYGQRLYIEERDHGYFGSWPARGFTGFDYLLYPARSWPADPGFRLNVAVEIPDARGKKLFFRVWKRPSLKSNLALEEAPSTDKRRRLFRGEFSGMPADILTVLLWNDPKAVRHLR
ncbi:MAG: hypothetical protein FJY82_05815 [Candidatus Aminicenantes bacterium]|nr:hypothetical protein [Candidatus Aminicenantes bacterium]